MIACPPVLIRPATAVRLWLGLGFEILATIPDAFDHPKYGPVGLHVMYRKL